MLLPSLLSTSTNRDCMTRPCKPCFLSVRQMNLASPGVLLSLPHFPAMRSTVWKRDSEETPTSHDRSGHAIAFLWIERISRETRRVAAPTRLRAHSPTSIPIPLSLHFAWTLLKNGMTRIVRWCQDESYLFQGRGDRPRAGEHAIHPRSHRNSNFQLALAVKRERHDAIGSNLPIVKPMKTAWDSGKRHQVRGTICRCSFVMPMPGMGATLTKAPSHKPDKPSAVT